MYKVEILGPNNEFKAWFWDLLSLSYEIRIDWTWRLTFSVAVNDLNATNEIIKHYNRVCLYRQNSKWERIKVFLWYIEQISIKKDFITITCPELIKFFQKRIIEGKDYNWVKAGDIVFDMLNYVNNIDDTYISEWINDTDLYLFLSLKPTTFLYWINKIRQISWYDIWIDKNFKLNVWFMWVERDIVLLYDSKLPETSNIVWFDVVLDWWKLLNRILWIANDINYIWEIDNWFPKLEWIKYFYEVNNYDTLKKTVNRELAKYATLQIIPKVWSIYWFKIFEDYNLGDYVNVNIKNWNFIISWQYRITAIRMNVDSNFSEKYSVELTNWYWYREDLLDYLKHLDEKINYLLTNK